jgi:hypothetical protein
MSRPNSDALRRAIYSKWHARDNGGALMYNSTKMRRSAIVRHDGHILGQRLMIAEIDDEMTFAPRSPRQECSATKSSERVLAKSRHLDRVGCEHLLDVPGAYR